MKEIHHSTQKLEASIKALVLLFAVFVVQISYAQSYTERGSQAITNYTPKEYNAGIQNFAITQDENGIMYFGNNMGLLVFDGVGWQLYQVPNKSTILSLAMGGDGKIFAGAIGDLGYFLADSTDRLTFHSLLEFVPQDKRDFAGIWNTYISNGIVYYCADNYIFIWNIQKKEIKIIQPENNFHVMFNVEGTIYVREWGKGLMVLENETLSLVKGGEKFTNERIYVMLPFPGEDGKILIGTRTMGLFKFDGSTFFPFKTEADQFMKDNLMYLPGTVLSDGNIVWGTNNGGAVVIDPAGREVHRYNLKNGISNNTIEFTFQDRSGALWLATNNGISRIDYSSPFSYFDSRNNFSTNTLDIIRHNGIIYTATDNGVYALEPKTSTFYPIENANNESFAFIETEKELLTGTFDGLFEIENNKLNPIIKTIGNEYNATALKKSILNPNRIYVGTPSGLWSVIKSGPNWINEGQIFDNPNQTTSITEDEGGSVWLGTLSSGLFRLTFHQDEKGIIIEDKPHIEHFDKTNGLQDGKTYVETINGKNYFITVDSIYIFDEQKKIFYPDFSDKVIYDYYDITDNKIITAFQKDNLGRLWIGTSGQLAMGTMQADSSWRWVSSPFNRIADEKIYKVFAEENGVVWFCLGSEIIKYDSSKKNPGNTDYSALVRSVEIGGDSIMYFSRNIDNPVIPEIPSNNNSVKFRYSATSYEGRNINKFKTFLEGFDDDWSHYSIETTKEYTNLPPGHYTFNVAALNISGIESSIGTWSFEILPPWYRTWWAYTFYVLVLGFVIIMTDRLQRGRLVRRERERAESEHREQELKHAKAIEKAYNELEISHENLKTTQAQLIQSEKMASLGELTAGIAHEIQNPLNFVNNFSEVSMDLIEELNEELKKGDTEEVNAISTDLLQNLEKINNHGKRASNIVKSMLEHSRKGSGVKVPTDINALADEFLRLAYHGLRAKDKSFNADFKLEADESLPKINVVPQDIGRVLLNLINNAFYAVNEKVKQNVNDFKPLVVLTTSKGNNMVTIKVKDNGNGIPDSVKNKIFQPFFTTKPTGQGTGLGLSMSYDIITKGHGGSVEVNSIAGEGSEFIIRLPE